MAFYIYYKMNGIDLPLKGSCKSQSTNVSDICN